eukprot:scaffold3471_cov87-Attheya_sp.AAC.3
MGVSTFRDLSKPPAVQFSDEAGKFASLEIMWKNVGRQSFGTYNQKRSSMWLPYDCTSILWSRKDFH